jgi:hypothetical protein
MLRRAQAAYAKLPFRRCGVPEGTRIAEHVDVPVVWQGVWARMSRWVGKMCGNFVLPLSSRSPSAPLPDGLYQAACGLPCELARIAAYALASRTRLPPQWELAIIGTLWVRSGRRRPAWPDRVAVMAHRWTFKRFVPERLAHPVSTRAMTFADAVSATVQQDPPSGFWWPEDMADIR